MALIIGAIDGALFFFLVIAIYLFGLDVPPTPVANFQKLFTLFWWEVVFILLPLSAFVGWRGRSDVQRILLGKASFVRPILEGFFTPFIPLTVFQFAAALNVAFAAGQIYDGAKEWNFMEWLQYTFVVLGWSAFVGVMGVVCALGLHLLNRFLIKRLGGVPAV
jgi:hypothetical protein